MFTVWMRIFGVGWFAPDLGILVQVWICLVVAGGLRGSLR